MIVILHKILFNGSISDHKKYFLWLFFPEFNMCRRLLRQALLCVIHSIFYDKVCLLYTYRVRSTLSQIDIPIIWFFIPIEK